MPQGYLPLAVLANVAVIRYHDRGHANRALREGCAPAHQCPPPRHHRHRNHRGRHGGSRNGCCPGTQDGSRRERKAPSDEHAHEGKGDLPSPLVGPLQHAVPHCLPIPTHLRLPREVRGAPAGGASAGGGVQRSAVGGARPRRRGPGQGREGRRHELTPPSSLAASLTICSSKRGLRRGRGGGGRAKAAGLNCSDVQGHVPGPHRRGFHTQQGSAKWLQQTCLPCVSQRLHDGSVDLVADTTQTFL
mmetsp:Transcript_76244/g.246754  ORF Transcript_76244/g.246754 Transcript_76244/m.246754 type:complete len:246 (-) Transcript_76244:2421-3158(-)